MTGCRFHRSLAVTLGALALIAVTTTADNARKAGPDFSLTTSSGASIALADLKGKVVLLDVWATWCTGCKVEIPWFVEFHKRYAADGLTAVGVAMDEDGWTSVRPYLAQHPISYPVAVGTFDLLQKTLGLPASLPVTLLIDRKGRIASTHSGVVDKAAFERELQQLLRER